MIVSQSVTYSADALKELSKAIADVSSNVFPSARPKTVKEQMKSFVVISCPTRWSDKGILQRTTMRIQCFYREKENGVMPVGNVGSMCKKVFEKFPFKSGRFTYSKPVLIHDCASDNLGFGYATIHITLQVNTTDKFNN